MMACVISQNARRNRGFEPGQAVAGVRIEARIEPAPDEYRKARYRCTALCCGREVELSFGSIESRLTQGVTRCPQCAARAIRENRRMVIRVGDVVAGMEVLAELPDSHYEVRHRCCGRVETLTHELLMARRRRGRVTCGVCTSPVRARRRERPRRTVARRRVRLSWPELCKRWERAVFRTEVRTCCS